MERTEDNDIEVVSLVKYQNSKRFPAITQLSEYWSQLRGNRPLPLRADVDPRAIESTLEYAFVLERIAPNIARFRLAGMHLNELMGMEVRGMPMTSFFVPSDRNRAGEVLEAVFSQPATAVLTLEAETATGKPDLLAQLVLLPLRSDFGDVSRILGGLVSQGPIGRAPRRFAITDVQSDPVATEKPLAQSVLRKTKPKFAPVTGFSEPQSSFAGKPKPHAKTPGKRPHLYLVGKKDS